MYPIAFKRIFLLFFLFLFAGNVVFSQSSLRRANKFYELNEFNAAVEAYIDILNKEPANLEALSKIADSYRMLNQMEEAAQFYEQIVQQRGFDPIILFHYGKVLKALGKYEEAKKWFATYAEAYPGYGEQYISSCSFAQELQKANTIYEIKREYINSPEADFAPAFNNDKIVFASARTDIIPESQRRKASVVAGVDNQLYVSGRTANGFLNKPEFFHTTVQYSKNEGPLSFSKDGKWVAYTRNNFVNNHRQIPEAGMELSIYICSVDRRGIWSEPIPFSYNGSGFSTGYPCFADNGSTLYFASNRPDGYGGFDIFVSRRDGNSWTVPKNLGPVINSSGNEISPFFDGQEMYFASDWHEGLGGYDIFKVSKVGDNWRNFSNLGIGINSPRDDYGLIYDAVNNLGYFTSNRIDGKGNEDIYQFRKNTEDILITIKDGLTNEPIEGVLLDFSDCGAGEFKTNPRGQYRFAALSNFACSVVLQKEGYADYELALTGTESGKSQSIDITMFKDAEQYIGRVIDSRTNAALRDVYIKATNLKNSQKFDVRTNSKGEYTLPLSANSRYMLKFSKAGYMDINKAINVDSGSDKSVLGTMPLVPTGTAFDESGGTIEDEGELKVVEEETGNNNTVELPSEGYSVQVAAFFNKDKFDLNKFQKLRSVGNVYPIEEKGAIKVRVGIYPTKYEAEQAKKEIAQKGYGNTFIVNEQIDSRKEDILLRTSQTDNSETKNYDTNDRFEEKSVVGLKDYKIRLATYSNPDNFNSSKVKNLGLIEEKKKGSFTIMLLSGYATLEEAKRARQEAVKAGFTGAQIVQDYDGDLIKVD